jgi:hypothetical protein
MIINLFFSTWMWPLTPGITLRTNRQLQLKMSFKTDQNLFGWILYLIFLIKRQMTIFDDYLI